MDDVTYPIRRRGEKRSLNPNRKGAAWLEEQADHLTKIVGIYPLGEADAEGRYPFEGFTTQGSVYLIRTGGHLRRMFDVFRLGASSGMPVIHRDPCPACLDFSRSWNCPEHGELAWDAEKGRWGRDPVVAAHCVNPFGLPPRHQRQGLRLRLRNPAVTIDGVTVQGVASVSMTVEEG